MIIVNVRIIMEPMVAKPQPLGSKEYFEAKDLQLSEFKQKNSVLWERFQRALEAQKSVLQKLEQCQKESAMITQERESLLSSLDQLDANNSDLQKQIVALEQKAELNSNAFEAIQKENSELQSQVLSLSDVVKQHRSSHAELEARLETSTAQSLRDSSALNQTIEKQKIELEEMRALPKSAAVQSKIVELEANVAELQKLLDTKSADVVANVEALAKLQVDTDELRKANKLLLEKNEGLNAKVAKAKQGYQDFNARVKVAISELQEKDALLSRMVEALESLQR